MTWRGLILGVVMVLVVCVGALCSIWLVGTSEITWSFFPIAVGVPFLVVVLANAGLRRLVPRLAFTRPELITAAVMALVASGIPIFLVGLLLAIPSKPYYGATPENEWTAFVQPYLPVWAIPSPDGGAMRYFYEGLPRGGTLPYGAWLGPLVWWLALLLAVYFVCFCLVVLLRRQWVDHERLAFPMTEVPRMLTEQEEGRALPPVMRSLAFWIGCAVPGGMILFNAISYFQPGFPQVMIIHFPVTGFMFLVSTGISFSVWFFMLLVRLENGAVTWAGYNPPADTFVYTSMTALSWQTFGAFAAMVLWSLWMARNHLAAVARTVFRHSGELDDSDEMLPYPVAVYGALGGSLFALVWLWRSGMDLAVALLFLLAVLIVYLGITRLVIQAGIHYVTTPMPPQAVVVAVTGTAIDPHNLVGLALSYAWCSDIQSIFMPSAAHGARLNEICPNRRGMALAIGVAIVVGLMSTIALMLYLCYQTGASNFRSWFFSAGGGAGGLAFDTATRWIRDPVEPDAIKLSFLGLGATAYSLLAFLQYRFYWWPLHPVGLAVATVWMMDLWAVLLAWAAKALVLRIGGIEWYVRVRPFFIGLIVGFFFGVGISYGIDVIWFYGKGHYILHG